MFAGLPNHSALLTMLIKDNAQFMYVALYIAHQNEFRVPFTTELQITPLWISHIEKINNFFITQQKTSWIYLDIAVFQEFKAFFLLPHACEDFAGVFATEK